MTAAAIALLLGILIGTVREGSHYAPGGDRWPMGAVALVLSAAALAIGWAAGKGGLP